MESAVGKSGISDGIALVSAMHITAGVYVNDAEEGLIADIDQWLDAYRGLWQRRFTRLDKRLARMKENDDGSTR